MVRGPHDDDAPWLAEGVREERATLVPRARLIGGGLIAVLLAVLVALGVFLAVGHKSDGSAGYARPEDAPLIAADPGAYKVAPENPGGAQITGIDDSVAAVASGSEQAGAIAADTPEEPIARPTGAPPPTDLLPPRSDAPPRETAHPPVPAPTKSIEPAPVTPPVTKPAKTDAPKPIAAPKPESSAPRTEPAAAKSAKATKTPDPLAEAASDEGAATKPAKPAAKGNVTLQLGAFSSRDKADAAWAKAAGDGALTGLAKRIEPVDRDGTTLYRLRAGGVASADAAKALCARIRSAGNACIVAE
ncbi:MAG: SPOR domain-containing protein [Sphingomonadaceae bacterium]|nr:SPOR domain-containing protein [Sphingomonadaceae bacterium]